MSRPTKPVHYAVVGVSVIYTIVLYLAHLRLNTQFKQVLALLPALAAGALTLWDLVLWRLPGLRRLTARPRLHGLWRAELHPTEQSVIPAGGNRGPISAYLVVTQTYWSIAVRQYTEESKSDSRASFWHRGPDAAVETLSFLYDNDPQQRYEARSQRHLGSCTLDSTSREPIELTGVYFTDRYTKGDMTMTLVDRSTGHPSFASAQAHQPSTKRWWQRKSKAAET